MEDTTKQKIFLGMRVGAPIAVGYFACAMAIGIRAAGAGLSVWQAALFSLVLNASAGEYAAFGVIAAGGAYLETALMQAVANARYFLMSCALGQKLPEKTGALARIGVGADLTDELFSVAMSPVRPLSAAFYFGMEIVTVPAWVGGTAVGAWLGECLPGVVVGALSLGLYGMFLSTVVPAAKHSRVLSVLIPVSMAVSLAATFLPVLSSLSEGVRTAILTVALAALFAAIHPVKEGETPV